MKIIEFIIIEILQKYNIIIVIFKMIKNIFLSKSKFLSKIILKKIINTTIISKIIPKLIRSILLQKFSGGRNKK